MSRRVLILLILLVVIVGGAAVLYTQVIAPGQQPTVGTGGNPGQTGGPGPVVDTPTPIQVTPILVAVQDIPRGLRIPENGIDVRYFPTANVPTYALGADELKSVVGKIARSDIAREQPILSTLLVDDISQVAKTGSDAAAVIPTGRRAITIPIDRNSSVSYAPRDGDTVDVIVSFLVVDVDENFQSRQPNSLSFTTVKQDGTIDIVRAIEGRLEPSSFSQFPIVTGPSETQRPRLTTQTTIQNAVVIHMGNFPLTGNFLGNTPTPIIAPTVVAEGSEATKGPPPPTATTAFPETITLAVTPQEANVLAWLNEAHVPMTLVLRNPRDPAAQQLAPVTLRYIVENYQVQVPPRLPYALEPALRSVRQLVNGTLVPFAQDNPVTSGTGGTGGGK